MLQYYARNENTVHPEKSLSVLRASGFCALIRNRENSIASIRFNFENESRTS